MRALLDLLRDPRLNELNLDTGDRLTLHRKMLAHKPMLQKVFVEFHHLFRKLDRQFFAGEGIEVEIGSGVAPMRDSYPDVLATDIVYSAHLDRVLNAEQMDFEPGSVRAIFGQNCFHHFPHPDQFFHELDRVLCNGGGAVLLEPYYGPFASFLFKRMFKTEGFDKTYPSWETPISGPMNGANQALSYIVFVRDRSEFEKKFPSLQIVHLGCVSNYLKYLISGGLNFRQLLPDAATGVVGVLEKILFPFRRWLALHHVIVIRKGSA
jgi:SAM-dependent methyltransferase